MWSFGDNRYGQLGIGNNNNQSVPQKVVLSGVSGIASGYSHSTAICADGSVWSWGYNGAEGRLGITSTSSPQHYNLPCNVLSSKKIVSVATSSHTLALGADGSVWSWGYNGYGNLGLGHTTNSQTPQLSLQPQKDKSLKLASCAAYCYSSFVKLLQ